MRKIPLKITGFAVLMLTAASQLHAAAPATKPNIVLIMMDDFGYECVTANGGESYKTPVMDRLAATGVRFEQCHAQPLCTPTRVQLMTGIGNRRNYSRFGHLDPSQTTFGNLLKNAGYATCVAGKWQLDNGPAGVRKFGFDEYALWQLETKGSRYKNPKLDLNGKAFKGDANAYGDDVISDYVLDFITRKKDTPFFVYYPMMLTHAPLDPTPDSPGYLDSSRGNGDEKSKSKGGKETGHFPDMVAYSDKVIGKVIAKLDELKLRDNTLVLILGDNGTARGMPTKFQGREVQGGKGSSTVWGTRVPLIASWPGHIASGKVTADLVDTTDFLPTLGEVAGAEIPAGLKIDGRSFLPQLQGDKGDPRDSLYVWFNDSGGAEAEFEFAHDGTYKLYTTGKFYDVRKDDREKSPLADSALDADAKAAKAKLQAVLKQHEGPRPEFFAKLGVSRKSGKADPAESDEGASDGKKAKGKKIK